MSSPSRSAWRPTNDEMVELWKGIAGFVAAALGVPYLAPLGSLAVSYAYRNRERLFFVREDVIAPGQGWDTGARPVAGQSTRHEATEYDLLGLLRRPFSQQRITLTPRLTPEARAAGLRTGDPVPVALTDRWNKSEGGLIVPAFVDRPVTVALPRGDYAVLAYGSPGERLFRAHDPYLGIGNARLARERRTTVELALRPRATQQELTLRARPTLPGRPQPLRVPCLYCGAQWLPGLLLTHMLDCPQRPQLGLPADAGLPALGDLDTLVGGRSPSRPWRPPHARASKPIQVGETKPKVAPLSARTRESPQAARRRFIEQISQRGFWLGPGAKHVYYHDTKYLGSRIVLAGTRIRFEIGNKKTGKYDLWQSYRVVGEADLALGALAELKSRPPKR